MNATDADALTDKQRKALELHLAGASYQAIAQALGYTNRGTAHKVVQRALELTRSEQNLPETAPTELARLDAMLTGLWSKARSGNVQAIDRVLRIEERREAVLMRQAMGSEPEPMKETTSLSDFEKRLQERQQRATSGKDRSRKTR